MDKTVINKEMLLIRDGEGNIISDMDGETVMFSIVNGKYYNLGEIGGVIWGLLEHPKTPKEIIGNLLCEYEVDEETCETQVIHFLDRLFEERLIISQ